MAEEPKRSSDVPSLPVEDILVNVANSVVEAQRALDSASLESEIRIREAELDRQFGLSAHWYTIPELNFELRLAFELNSRGELETQMVDAEYQSKYGFNLKASSLLQTRIVATPAAEIGGLSLLDQKGVLKRVGAIKRIVAAYARSDTPFFVVRYRPFVQQGYAGGLWYVFLMDALGEGGRTLRALAVVDDASGEVVRLWTDAEAPPPDVGGDVEVDTWEFTPAQATAALALVNEESEEFLRDEIGLSGLPLQSILANRPFASISALGDAVNVGPATMRKIREYATAHGAPQ